MALLGQIETALSNRKRDTTRAFIDRNGPLSFADVWKELVSLDELLTVKHKCEPRDRIAAITLNSSQAVLVEWAAYRLDVIWIGIPWREREPERIIGIIKASQPKLLFVDPAALNTSDLQAVLRSLKLNNKEPYWRRGLACYRLEWTSELPSSCFEDHGIKAVRVRFTSGVSGQPKGVVYTQQTHEAIFEMINTKVLADTGTPPIMIHALPTSWASGSLIAPVFSHGGCNVLRPKYELDDFVETVRREECTMTFLVPKLLAQLSDYSMRHGNTWARTLKRILLAGAPTPVRTMRQAKEQFPSDTEFFTTLGMTEASFPITWNRVGDADYDKNTNKRPYVPLGGLTHHYKDSCINESDHLLVRGGALAPADWNWIGGPFPSIKLRHKAHDAQDTVEEDSNGILHYVCRSEAPWVNRIWIATDAVEALLREHSGIKEARVDGVGLSQDKSTVRVHCRIQPTNEYLDEETIKKFFNDGIEDANLRPRVADGEGSSPQNGITKDLVIAAMRFGKIEMTSSGKVARKYNAELKCGVDNDKAQDWNAFDFSRLGSEPLYFYVGSGLSQAAGLVGWKEMARILWWYLTNYEGRSLDFPLDNETANQSLLNNFVNEPFWDGENLSRENSSDLVLGRVALLNMLLRSRKPNTYQDEPERAGEPPKCCEEPDRVRCGEDPIAEDLVLQSLVWRAKCHGVLTPNYDMLLEHAHSLFNHGSALRSYRYNADFLRYIMSNRRFVLKLHGDINDLRRMLFNPDVAWGPAGELGGEHGDDLRHVYKTALENGHMVYIGMGFRDRTIRELHGHWRKNGVPGCTIRVALVQEKDLQSIKNENRNAGFGDELYDDISFQKYPDAADPSGVAFKFLSRIVEARARHNGDQRGHCPEAQDIYNQVFFMKPEERPGRRWETKKWTCKGTRIDGGSVPTSEDPDPCLP